MSKQIEINIDYILLLVKKYHDENCQNKELLVTIQKAVDASPELRSKKELIEAFINRVNQMDDDVMTEWRSFVRKRREEELKQIIDEEQLDDQETRNFMRNAFREGEVRTVGTDIDRLMPRVSRFGSSGRDKKKKGIIEKLKAFFEKFFGIGADFDDDSDDLVPYDVPENPEEPIKAAEPQKGFNAD